MAAHMPKAMSRLNQLGICVMGCSVRQLADLCGLQWPMRCVSARDAIRRAAAVQSSRVEGIVALFEKPGRRSGVP